VLEGAGEPAARVGIVAQPVQQLREAPFRGVDAAAPLDRLEPLPVRERGDLGGFLPRTVIAPQVVVAERLQPGVDGDDARAGRVDRDRRDLAACDCVAKYGSSCLRCSGYSDTAEPSRPRSLSTIDTRTLSVPKSTPATTAICAPVPAP
jgi:hypothetical protein